MVIFSLSQSISRFAILLCLLLLQHLHFLHVSADPEQGSDYFQEENDIKTTTTFVYPTSDKVSNKKFFFIVFTIYTIF